MDVSDGDDNDYNDDGDDKNHNDDGSERVIIIIRGTTKLYISIYQQKEYKLMQRNAFSEKTVNNEFQNKLFLNHLIKTDKMNDNY